MDKIKLQVNEWKNSNVQVFWGEIAPCDHVVQIYENDNFFLNTLEGFAGCGLLSGDSVVIIATQNHLDSLNQRLRSQNLDLDTLIKTERYFPLEATETLSKFMVNNWPDEKLFENYVSAIITRATKGNRKVRAFGEMVAVLWAQGLNGATLRLEHMWHNLYNKKKFSLYCAYPRNGFTQGAHDSMDAICKAHTKIIDGQSHPSTEIYYKSIL
ncbi:MAG TPA: MEDS domain-containing protein [Flavobacteriales bacterium]|nr:MEDS domain-containing protein [Flavobacteriales bacterium]